MAKQTAKQIQQAAAAIAREHWAVKPGQVSVQGRLRIPANLEKVFEEQATGDRGQTWADGYLLQQQIGILHGALRKLSGSSVSFICDQDITLLVGQQSFTADTQLKALLAAIAHYMPQEEALFEQSDFDLETRLTELDLLE